MRYEDLKGKTLLVIDASTNGMIVEDISHGYPGTGLLQITGESDESSPEGFLRVAELKPSLLRGP